MLKYKLFSNGISIIISVILILYTVFLLKFDDLAVDIYIWNSLFSLVFILNFTFYVWLSVQSKVFNHLNFKIMPISRFHVFKLEFFTFLRNTSTIVFSISIIYFNCAFFYLNNYSDFLDFLSISIISTINLLTILFMLFVIKNYRVDFIQVVRNLSSVFLPFVIFLIIFSEKSKYMLLLLKVLPISGGLFSFIFDIKVGVLSFFVYILFVVSMYLVMQKRLKTWL